MNDLKQSRAGKTTALGAPNQVIVAAANPAHIGALMGLIGSVGLKEQDNAETTSARPKLIKIRGDEPLKSLHENLARHPEAHLLVTVSLPTMAIAARLEQGTKPDQALTEWEASILKLLELVRPNRRRTSLVFIEAAMAAPTVFLKTLAQRLRIEPPHRQLEAQQPELPGSFWHLIADYAMRQSIDTRDLVAELEATALPLPAPENSGLPSAGLVFEEYQNSIEKPIRLAGQLETQAGKLKDENQLLSKQLQQVQKELHNRSLHADREAERYEEALQETRQHLESAARDQVTKLQKTLDDAHHQLDQEKGQRLASERQRTELIKQLQEENELLLQQLNHVQEELESNYLRNQREAAEREQTRQQLQAAHMTILAIYGSYSWRVSRPLRWVQYLLGGGRRPAVDKVPLPATVEDAQKTIEALYHSKSWKVTRPLRFVFSLFVRSDKEPS